MLFSFTEPPRVELNRFDVVIDGFGHFTKHALFQVNTSEYDPSRLKALAGSAAVTTPGAESIRADTPYVLVQAALSCSLSAGVRSNFYDSRAI